ncbi:MAG TPA: hypothetical protein VMG60_03490 [Burkholderiaceae bacterium]|nr:hypothetical protein [Burkholderiaceae bacterium]
MKSTSIVSRVLSAAMAIACSLVLMTKLGRTMDPSRLAMEPHVVEMERVVVTAPAPAPTVATARARTMAN